MPRGDGTGPAGLGAGAGRRGGGGRGGGFALGPGGSCVCPQCGKTVPHQRGVQCFNVPCPACGSAMTRVK